MGKISSARLYFCGAPHILIPHAPKNIPCAVQDVNMAAAYFELLCNANGWAQYV